MAVIYPFSAIVGQDRMRRSLILNAVDPRIGGVLIRGERGTAKSTAARALAALLPNVKVVSDCRFGCDPFNPDSWCTECQERAAKGEKLPVASKPTPFVNLPVSATEDRVVGTLDIEKAIQKIIEMESNQDEKSQQLSENKTNLYRAFYSEIKKMNGLQVSEKIEKSFFSASFTNDQTLEKRSFFVIPEKREREMKKNSLIGSSLQKPIKSFEDMTYLFAFQEDGNKLFHSEKVGGLDKKSLPRFIIYLGGYNPTNFYASTAIVGILATGATALYSGAQKKAKAAALRNTPITPSRTEE